MRFLLRFFCFAVLLFTSLFIRTPDVFATTYYVDATGGSDSNSGTSTGAPWQTVDKVNDTTFSSGDYVYFKKGETWTFDHSSDLLIAESGVTYGAYGSGNNPLIDGDGVSDGMLGVDVINVRLENLRFTNCYDACAQFIRTSNVSVIDCEMSGAGNDNLIFITNNNNVTIRGGTYYNPVRRIAGTQITNIELADGGSNFTIDDVEVYGAENAGVTIHNHTDTQLPTNVTVNNLYSHDNTGNGLQVLTQDETDPVDIDVTNSRFISNDTGIRVLKSGSYYASGDILFDKNIVGNNTSYGIYMQGDDVTVQRSVFYGTNQSNRVYEAKTMSFKNNTVYNSPSSAIWMFFILGGARVDGVVLKNNIFYMTTTSGNFVGSAASSSTNMDVDYNQYYFSPYAGNARWMKDGTAYTFANWQGTAGFDTNGLGPTSNPLFVDAASNDFRLQSTSPSINAGVDVSLSYAGSAPDIGAYEYAVATVPTGLSQSISGRNLTFIFSMSSLDPTDTLTPQIEIQPIGTAFTNIANYSGTAISYPGLSVTGTVDVSNFGSGGFHWQAGISNYVGNSSWTSYGSGSSNDFYIDFPVSGPNTCSQSFTESPLLYSAVAEGQDSIHLYFSDSGIADSYSLEYGTSSGSYPFGAVGIAGRGANQYLVDSLRPNTKYFFRVRGQNGCAVGPWSSEISGTAKTTGVFGGLTITPSQTEIGEISEEVNKNEITEGYTLKVKVVDEDQKPLVGVKVTLHSKVQEAITNDDGIVEFTEVEGGEHRLLISYNKYEGEQTLNLSGDMQEFNLNVTVKPKGIVFSPLAAIIIASLLISLIILLLKLRSRRSFAKIRKE